MTPADTLLDKLKRRDFVITAEIAPRLTADRRVIAEQVAPLKGRVDAINVTDCAGARVTMSSLGAAALLVAEGIEPIMHVTCRDRNRIALAADLVAASALGIRNLLILTGDDPRTGDEPDARPVYDLDAAALTRLARRLGQPGVTPSGRALEHPARFCIGAADTPFRPPPEWRPERLEDKIRAGVAFVQTQFCFQPGVTRRYFERLAEFDIPGRLPILVGVGPLVSARSARWLNDNLYGVSVPDAIIRRLETAADPPAEGLAICAELIDEYRELPGVAGVHLMAPAQGTDRIAAVLDRAGLRMAGRLAG